VLDDRSWVDIRRGWVTGSDALFRRLSQEVPWHAERRRMYDRVVDVPRLTAFLEATADWPDDGLGAMRDALNAYYRDVLPVGFATVGLCLYRDGHDSVAWHGDTIGAGATSDTLVAIVSLGAPRVLALRPRARGARGTHRITMGAGDLLVMGGACQREWEHAVPKTTRPVGPRISLQFRQAGVR
jgi:alkylated DNA repair dioxygenase AlkB